MDTVIKNKDIYEVQFEQLIEGEKIPLNSVDDVMNAQMSITISMGSRHEKIEKILNYKVGDVIELDKNVEEALDINVNGKMVASGESIIMDNKLAIRLSKIKTENDN